MSFEIKSGSKVRPSDVESLGNLGEMSVRNVRDSLSVDFYDDAAKELFTLWVKGVFSDPLLFGQAIVGQSAMDALLEDSLEKSYNDEYFADPVEDLRRHILGERIQEPLLAKKKKQDLQSVRHETYVVRKAYQQELSMAAREVTEVVNGVIVHTVVDQEPTRPVNSYEFEEEDGQVRFLIPYYRRGGETVSYGQLRKELTGKDMDRTNQWHHKEVREVYWYDPVSGKKRLAQEIEIVLRDAYDTAVKDREAKKAKFKGTFINGLYDETNRTYKVWDKMRTALLDYNRSTITNVGTITLSSPYLKAYYAKEYGPRLLISPVVIAEQSGGFSSAQKEWFKERDRKRFLEMDSYFVRMQELLEIEGYLELNPSDTIARMVFEVEVVAFYRKVQMECPWHLFYSRFKGSCGLLQPFRKMVNRLAHYEAIDEIPLMD